MTNQQLKARLKARLRLTSAVSDARLQDRLNERMREAQTSVGLAHVRRGSVTVPTVANTPTVVTTGIVKAQTVSVPALNRVLEEKSANVVRMLDSGGTTKGAPWFFVRDSLQPTTETLRLFPVPDGIYSLLIDGVLVGTDMSANGDVPGLPEDYHDMLIDGVMADEYADLEKGDLAGRYQQRWTERLRDCRYFVAKTAWLTRRQAGRGDMPWWLVRAGVWPVG